MEPLEMTATEVEARKAATIAANLTQAAANPEAMVGQFRDAVVAVAAVNDVNTAAQVLEAQMPYFNDALAECIAVQQQRATLSKGQLLRFADYMRQFVAGLLLLNNKTIQQLRGQNYGQETQGANGGQPVSGSAEGSPAADNQSGGGSRSDA